MKNSLPEPRAYFNGRFIPASQAAIPVYDAGFVLGVTVSEQMRTFRGQLFRLDQHLQRLNRSLGIVGVDPGVRMSELAVAARQLAAENHALLEAGDDLGMSLFVTPGPYPAFRPSDGGPTVCMHTYPAPFALWADTYECGQTLMATDIQQVPCECWPAELKCRSRMHYYLAERKAHSLQPGARALLLDSAGYVTESPTANLVAYYKDIGLVSPPRDKILPGISLGVLAELAENLQVPFSYRQLTVDDVAAADEVMLTSTSPCLLPVSQLNGRAIGGGAPGDVFRRFLAAWSGLVGVDIRRQAIEFSDRR